MSEATILTKVKIDVNPEGITFNIEGLDSDLVKLIEAAGSFEVKSVEYHTYDTSDITIQSSKAIKFVSRAPKIVTVDSIQGKDIDLVFVTDPKWEAGITSVAVNGNELSSGSYTIVPGKITILSSVFLGPGKYTISISSNNYLDATATQTIV